MIRKDKPETQLFGIFISFIAEYSKAQTELVTHFFQKLRTLRTDSNYSHIQFLQIRYYLLQSFQLSIAVWSPVAAIEADYQWTLTKQIRR